MLYILITGLSLTLLTGKEMNLYAAKEENLGSLNQKTLEITTTETADAKIDLKNGIVICSTIDKKKYQIPTYTFCFWNRLIP